MFNLELVERLLGTSTRNDTDNVEFHGLREGTALTDDDHITLVNFEAGRAVDRESLMTLLVSLVLGTEVKIVTTNDNSSVHGGALHNTTQKMPTNADIASEGALLVNIVTNDGFTGGLEAETNGTIVASGFLGLLAKMAKLVQRNSLLLLE